MLRINPLVLSVCLFDGSSVMRESRHEGKVCEGSQWELQGSFKLCFAVATSPTSPYKRRNWLYSADQDGDSEWRGAEVVAERAPKQQERGG